MEPTTSSASKKPASYVESSRPKAPALMVESNSVDTTVAARSLADRLGICLSALCVVHCLLTPVALLIYPALEASKYHGVFHEGLLFILPLLAVIAFIPGYRRHRDPRVFYWSAPGLIAIAIGALVFHEQMVWQIAFSVTGSLLLIRAHLINRSLCACCEAGHK